MTRRQREFRNHHPRFRGGQSREGNYYNDQNREEVYIEGRIVPTQHRGVQFQENFHQDFKMNIDLPIFQGKL